MWTLTILAVGFYANLALGMRTAPPDDIIAILESGDYNKHHLPTYGINITVKANRTLSGPNGWRLILEHYQMGEYGRIRMIYKELQTGRKMRIEFNKSVAKRLTEEMVRFIDYYLNKANYGRNKNQYSKEYSTERSSAPLYSDQLLSAEIRIDPLRVYYVNYVRKTTGEEALLITEAKGRTRRQTVLIPSLYWQNVTEILDEFIETRYAHVQGPPMNVTIGMYIESMSSFRAQTMDFQVDIYFAESWFDPRLQHSSQYPALLRDMDLFEKMWHPDLYFANSKDAKYHIVTAANFLVYIYPNGSIYLDIRISLVLNCMMDLSHYPLDQQKCYIRILSYAYDEDNLKIIWKEGLGGISLNPDIKLTDMELIKTEATYCNGIYDIGNWSCAIANFKTKRLVMHHVLQSYLPTALIVVISWFSFWLDVDAVPGRVSLCITTLLTLATQAQAAKMSLPQVAYAKAIDVWMGTCMGFVFGVMIEFTVVNYISRRTSKSKVADLSARKRSSSRLLPSNGPATTPAGRLSEFHNLLFDVTGVGPDDPRFQTSHDADSTVGLMCQHHNHKESNGYARHHSPLTHRQSCASCSGENQTRPQQQTPTQQQQAQRNRKLAITVDRVSRFIFPCSFILFNMLYWPYYLLPRMEL